MVLRTGFRHLLIGLLGLSLLPSLAEARETLAEAVRKLDGKYLDAPDVVGIDDGPKIEAGSGEESEPEPQEIAKGPVKATLTYVESTDDDGNVTRDPIVTVFVDEEEVAKIEGDGGFTEDPPVGVQIAELDPSNAHPEVVVSFYTGGAHCCSDTSVISSNEDGSAWTTINVGEFDGGPLLAVDLDGDGRYEFETRDNAFLYTFACYACSEAPLEVLAIENGAVKTVSADPRFRPAHAAWLKNMIANVPEDDVNGFLAGYVGEKILLGEGKPAWELMLAHYDKKSDWGLETCDQELNENGECPGKEVKLTFPEALERMLKESGYTIEP
ncbi:MAG: hypothetical protein FJX44_00905 [Alphaproteobacteria bacterium]|nr:hypothetical protein [Alphaproteobacteria bacterium]